MASLAPGNGWFPNQVATTPRSPSAVPRRAEGAPSNVYEFPPVRAAAASRNVSLTDRGVLARIVAGLVAEAARAGRSDAWLIGWCLAGVAMVCVAWIALVGALFAAAVLVGLPWVTAAATLAAANALAGLLVVRTGLRHARKLLQGEGSQRLGVRRSV